MVAQLRVLKSILDTEVALKRIREGKGKREGILFSGKYLKMPDLQMQRETWLHLPTMYVQHQARMGTSPSQWSLNALGVSGLSLGAS